MNPRNQVLWELIEGNDQRPDADRIAWLYDELRAVARQLLPNRAQKSLEPTALVHEAFLKLARGKTIDPESRRHFFCIAAQAMRNLVRDNARERASIKRGGQWKRVTLTGGLLGSEEQDVEILALDEALTRLAQRDERQSRVVELRFFSGLSTEEVAEVMQLSLTTIKDAWRGARAWLRRELARGLDGE